MKKLLILLAITMMLTGCADHITFEQAMKHDLVGFWFGLWHGLIFPFAFIISLFDPTVSVYAIYNNGSWYNFGYLIGLSSVFGGCTCASTK